MPAERRYDLDHVALAANDATDSLDFLVGDLGATVSHGGQAFGFRPVQVWVGDASGDGMMVELIEPWETARNDFLARFVERHGPGPHHLTFKVADLRAALDRCHDAGYHPVGVDLSNPMWMEAFLVPREAHGTVVQLAQAGIEYGTRVEMLARVAAEGPHGHPRWWPDPPESSGTPAILRRVVVGTPSPAATLGFYAGLLQGDVVGEDPAGTELGWPGGARVRVEERTDRPPGIDRLEVEGLPSERVVAGTRYAPAATRPGSVRDAG